MAFGTLDSRDDQGPVAEINMVPLIDVMLVLLIIFIVTAPLLTHAVKVDLPQASSEPNLMEPDAVELSIDAAGRLHWNSEAVSPQELTVRLQATAARAPIPELHLRVDRTTPYERVAEVMSEAARMGMTKIGFVTEPASER